MIQLELIADPYIKNIPQNTNPQITQGSVLRAGMQSNPSRGMPPLTPVTAILSEKNPGDLERELTPAGIIPN